MNDTLSQRQRWFRSFPEGTLEFLLVTRISSVFLLLALAVVRESQRPLALSALAVMLLLDYVLMIWWVVQMAADLNALYGRGGGASPISAPGSSDGSEGAGDNACAADPESRPNRALTALLACLPAVVMFLALTPWPDLAAWNPGARATLMRVLPPVAGVLFVVFLVIGIRRIRSRSPPKSGSAAISPRPGRSHAARRVRDPGH